jgi:hypothetical protein
VKVLFATLGLLWMGIAMWRAFSADCEGSESAMALGILFYLLAHAK